MVRLKYFNIVVPNFSNIFLYMLSQMIRVSKKKLKGNISFSF